MEGLRRDKSTLNRTDYLKISVSYTNVSVARRATDKTSKTTLDVYEILYNTLGLSGHDYFPVQHCDWCTGIIGMRRTTWVSVFYLQVQHFVVYTEFLFCAAIYDRKKTRVTMYLLL